MLLSASLVELTRLSIAVKAFWGHNDMVLEAYTDRHQGIFYLSGHYVVIFRRLRQAARVVVADDYCCRSYFSGEPGSFSMVSWRIFSMIRLK